MAISSGTFDSLGSAASSIFGGLGSLATAKGYKEAAGYSAQNAEIARQSAAINSRMAEQKVYQGIGGQQSDVAGAGLASSGSALDLLRSSAEQGSLTKQLVAAQGAIEIGGYEAEAASYSAMASASKKSGIGGLLGGALKLASVAAPFVLASDDRLKHNSRLIMRRSDGLGIYEFSYHGSTDRFRGVMASEVEKIYPAAVSTGADGYRQVDYSMLNVVPEHV